MCVEYFLNFWMYKNAITLNTPIFNKVIQCSEHIFTSLDKSSVCNQDLKSKRLQMYNFIKHLFAM